LLDRSEDWTEPGMGELLTFDRRANLDSLEFIVLHDAFELGDRRVRMLHRQRRHAAQAPWMLSHHLGNAIIAEFGRSQASLRAERIEIGWRRDRERRDVDPHAIHRGEFGLNVVELPLDQAEPSIVLPIEFAASLGHLDAIELRPADAELRRLAPDL